MRTQEIKGVTYTEQACKLENDCVGCAGAGLVDGGEGICMQLPADCTHGGGTIWVRAVTTPDEPAPAATTIIDETELRDLWKRAYLVAIVPSMEEPFDVAKHAAEDYRRARAEGIV
jgi:hypothetical protein